MGVRLGFPPFTFDRDERVLRRAGMIVPLPPKAAEALGLLLAEPGALVEKTTLREALWPDGFVEDGNLTQTIYVIRRALDPDGDGRVFVETIPRRGYRFAPPVIVVEPAHPTFASRVVFALRAVVAVAVIAVASGGVSIGRSSSSSPPQLTGEAARAYAVGRYNWNRRTESAVRTSIVEFARVVQLAPNDARGYAGLADSYMTTGDWAYTSIAPRDVAFRRAETYAREALRRDPRSGEALTSLGWIALVRDHDIQRTERTMRTAVALRPDHAPAYEFLGVAMLYDGDAEGATLALHRATELDPLSPIDLMWYGKALYYSHRFAEARVAFRQLLELDSSGVDWVNKDARLLLFTADLELGRYVEARQMLATVDLPPEKRRYRAMYDVLLALRTGKRPSSLPDLRPRDAAHVDVATASAVCLALGRRSDALAWLKLGLLSDPEMQISRKLFALDPRLTALHADAQFRSLVS